jgi:hypothetical protein
MDFNRKSVTSYLLFTTEKRIENEMKSYSNPMNRSSNVTKKSVTNI